MKLIAMLAKKRRREKHMNTNDPFELANAKRELPKLHGVSEKQINYADLQRSKAIINFWAGVKQAKRTPEIATALIAVVSEITEARYWLDSKPKEGSLNELNPDVYYYNLFRRPVMDKLGEIEQPTRTIFDDIPVDPPDKYPPYRCTGCDMVLKLDKQEMKCVNCGAYYGGR
jgi:rRNA maturation endonuclease Nob1